MLSIKIGRELTEVGIEESKLKESFGDAGLDKVLNFAKDTASIYVSAPTAELVDNNSQKQQAEAEPEPVKKEKKQPVKNKYAQYTEAWAEYRKTTKAKGKLAERLLSYLVDNDESGLVAIKSVGHIESELCFNWLRCNLDYEFTDEQYSKMSNLVGRILLPLPKTMPKAHDLDVIKYFKELYPDAFFLIQEDAQVLYKYPGWEFTHEVVASELIRTRHGRYVDDEKEKALMPETLEEISKFKENTKLLMYQAKEFKRIGIISKE